MADGLRLQIITPNKVEFDDVINSISITNHEGKMMIQKNYAPSMGIVALGEITINTQTDRLEKIIGRGLYTVVDNNLKIVTGFCLDHTKENVELIEKQKMHAYATLKDKANHILNFEQNLNIAKIIEQLKRK